MKKMLVFCSMVAVSAMSLMAARTPLAVWSSGDFADGSQKGNFTLCANGNAVAADGSTITIVEDATAGVTIDYPATVGTVTVAIRYSGMKAPAENAYLFTAKATAHDDRSCVYLTPMWHAYPSWSGEVWYNENNPPRSAPAAYPIGATGRFAYCYEAAGANGGYGFVTDWDGKWISLNSLGWGTYTGSDKLTVSGCAIGGPRNMATAPGFGLLKGLVIEEIAIYAGLLKEDALDEALPGEKRPLVPIIRYAADTGVETDANGNVTKWRNQGALEEDLFPHRYSNGGTASATAITLAQHNLFGPVVRFDKTNFLESEAVNTLGLTKPDQLYMVWVVDYNLASGSDEHGFFGLYPDKSFQEGPYPISTTEVMNLLTYRSLNVSYYGRMIIQLGCDGNEDHHGQYAHGFAAGRPGKNIYSVVSTDRLSYGYVGGGYDHSYQNIYNGGPLYEVEPGRFRVGHSSFCSTALMKGDVAEIRIYNHPFTAAMRFAVDGELAAKYGFGLYATARADEADIVRSEVIAGCTTEPCGFGDAPNGGAPVAQIPRSGTSGGLTAAFAEEPSADVGTLVYLANNGKTGAEKVWCIGGSLGARALPLTLTVDAETMAEFPSASLYFNEDGHGNWTKVSGTARAEGALTVTLSAGWKNGQYRFFEKTVTHLPAVWFSADQGVTLDDGGNVVKWENQGTMGPVLDLGPANDAPGVTVVQNEQFGTSLHFDAAHYLKQISDEPTCFGMKQNVGGTYFIVVDIPDANRPYYYDQMVFGLWPGDELEQAWSADWKSGSEFALSFTHNGRYFQQNFFGYSESAATFWQKVDRKPGKRLISLTAAYDFSFGRGQVAYVDGLVTSNAYSLANSESPVVHGPWAGTVYPGFLTIGYHTFAPADYTILCGDVAELRIYSYPLSMTEQAAVELELAAKYGFAAQTVGTIDPAAVRAHVEGAEVIGAEAFRGPQVTSMKTTWTDGTLSFAFKEEPPLPPATAGEGAGVKSLTYLGSDGADTRFVARREGSRIQDLPRTWYVASACPSHGGVLSFACDTSDAAEWKYRLARKANGADGFTRLTVAPDIGDGTLSFTFDTLEAGTYRLERRPANMGLGIVVR